MQESSQGLSRTGHQTELDPNANSKEFSDKLYFVPESFHALRREMQQFYPTMWDQIGGALAWSPETFVEYMATGLEIIIQFDSRNVDGICKKILDALRLKRGLKPLHEPNEYYLQDSQLPGERVIVENGTLIGTVSDQQAKREF